MLNLGGNQKSEYWNHDMNQNVKIFLSWAISTLVRCESVTALIYCWLECKLVQSLGEKSLTLSPKVEDSWTPWANCSTTRAVCIREMRVQVHHRACISIITIMETENTHCLPMVEWFTVMYSQQGIPYRKWISNCNEK